jgi:DNA-binding beta-propeller fold protein YncE
MAIETVVGRRAWIYSHNIGRVSEAGMGFIYPVGVAPAKDGVLYVANRGYAYAQSQRISKVTVEEEFITEFGRGGEEEGRFRFLTAVALDREENVYTSDEWLNRITVFDKDGTLLRTWGESGTEEGQLNGPSGLAFDPDDNLIVVNSLNSRVQKFSKEGRYLSGFGRKGSAEGELNMPWGIASDNNGDIYVADWNNNRVEKFSGDGAHLVTFGHGGSGPGSLRLPSGVAVDGDGDVYVVDWMNERVVIYDSEAKPLTHLRGDAADISKWAQMTLDSNPDMIKRLRQVPNLEEQLKVFRLPVACAFDQEANRLIVCDTHRARLHIYNKDSNYLDPQYNL